MEIDQNNSNDEYDEEEHYVYLNLEDHLTTYELDSSHLDVNVIGIDTENPIIDVNGKIFRGKYEYPYCTDLFFEKDLEPSSVDPIYEKVSEKYYRYLGKSNKRLSMSRMYIDNNDKATKEPSQNITDIRNELDENSTQELVQKLTKDMTYEEALNLFLKPGQKPPRKLEIEENSVENITDDENLDKSDKEEVEEMEDIKPKLRNIQIKKENDQEKKKFGDVKEMFEYIEDCDDEYRDPDFDPNIEIIDSE